MIESFINNEKIKAVQKEAKWTALVLSFITFLGQQLTLNGVSTLSLPIIKNISQAESAGISDYLTILQVFWTSAPLVIALSIIYVLLIRRSIHGWPLVIVSGIILYISAVVGNTFGFQQVGIYSNVLSRYLLGDVLQAYWNGYGILAFLSSLVVGFFTGRTYLKFPN
jgi:hypothetical protein